MDAVRGYDVSIIASFILLKSARVARNLNASLPGLAVPEGIIQELENAVPPAETSVEIAARIIAEIKEMCGGVHMIAMGWESRVPGILEAAGIRT